MQNREQLTQYMLQGHVHLSKKDYGFFFNIKELVATTGKITTNQNKLFEKLLHKYNRQLFKQKLNLDDLLCLTWNASVVETSREYTKTYVKLEGNDLVLKCPFNNKFLNTFRKTPNNPFVWSKQSKHYSTTFSTYALKVLYRLLPTHFDDIEYDYRVQQLIDQIKPLENHIFEPTLVDVNGNLMVLSCNNTLGELLKDIELEKSGQCFFALSRLGIKIDDTLLTSEFLRFASSRSYVINSQDLHLLSPWLSDLNVRTVTLGNSTFRKNNAISSDYNFLKSMLEKENIDCRVLLPNKYVEGPDQIDKSSEPSVLISWTSSMYNSKVSKSIVIKNSNQITIR